MLARQIAFFAPAAVLSAWATVMFHTVATGRINELLSPMFRNYVIIAGACLLAISVLYLLLFQPSNQPAPAFAPTGTLRQLGRWVMLLVPVVAASILAPSAFSSETISKRLDPNASYQMPTWYEKDKAPPAAVTASDPTQPAPVEVTDLIQLRHAADQAKVFEGRKVVSVGHLMAGAPGSAPKLVRLIMWCCAADAMPATVDLNGSLPASWKDDDWLEVTGTARFQSKNGHVIPVIDIDTIKPTQEPDEPYLSP